MEEGKTPATQQDQSTLRPLTDQQEHFCHEYLIDRNGTQAAIRAKYAPDSAKVQASRLLTNDNIKARINELIKKQLDNIKINVAFILRELLNSANIDINDAYNEDGTLKPFSEMPEPLRKSIIAVKSEELFEGQGKDREHIGTAKTIKIEGRLKALELLGKHLKMFTDVHDIPGLEGLAEAIKAARKRADKYQPSKKEPAREITPNSPPEGTTY